MNTRAAIGTLAASALLFGLSACSDEASDTTAPPSSASRAKSPVNDTLVALVRQLTEARGITPLPRPPHVRPELVRLGQALAFDKILSGNHDISCMTCHLPGFATTDGRSLSIGQGGTGLGPVRTHPEGIFIPRNSPPLFNLTSLDPLFWDGRVLQDERGNFHTPAGARLSSRMTKTLEFGAISAQPLFPVLSRAEMRGDHGNELARIGDDEEPEIWAALMRRLGKFPRYREMFERAYPGERFEKMTFAHASNAIAGFVIAKLAFNDSPWDRFLAGDDRALSPKQLLGAKDFMSARCSICQNGPALTDNKFHNVAVAQLGPGEGDGAGGHDDFGRMRVTGNIAEKYAFRTPPLRNVQLTAPYGHDGAIVSLQGFVDHYSESDKKLRAYNSEQLEAALRGTVLSTTEEILSTRDPLLNGVVFPEQTIDEVTEFMEALTDPAARHLRRIVPSHVPSGLPVD